jgi:hypothetical protein
MEDLTKPFPIYDSKTFAVHIQDGIEQERRYHNVSIDLREIVSVSGTLALGEEGEFALVEMKCGALFVLAENEKHLRNVWKDFVRNYKP